jgi:Heterokaryon incompatibility protein (HET)
MEDVAEFEHQDIYAPLHDEEQEIRLLHIAPGVATDRITTTLHVVSMSGNPAYEALSYTWGSLTITEPILVNCTPFRATYNMASALRRLRSPESTRVVWVDAVCINQQDIRERNSQVLLMSRIYSECSSCIIWLGEEDNQSRAAFQLLQLWSQDIHYDDWQHLREDFTAVDDMIKRPWWSRIWTVQEALLPQRSIILCGGQSLPWETLVLARDSVQRHENMDCCHEKYYRDEAWVHISSRFALVVDTYKNATGLDVIALANLFRGRQATDPRDKLIGLLSLTSHDERGLITPDYGVDFQSLYKDFTLACISEYGSLLPLSFILDHPSSTDLPSWVPDWRHASNDFVSQSYRISRYNLFDACSRLQPSIDTSRWNNSYFLKAEGILFDAINFVGRSDNENPEGNLKNCYESAMTILQNKYVTGENFDRAFWRTALLDTKLVFDEGPGPELVRSSSEFVSLALASGKELFDSINTDGELTVDMNTNEPSFVFSLVSAILHRRFFITERGYIGMSSERIEVGDLVYVFSGGKSPLVLRTAESDASTENDEMNIEDQPLHTLVGDCYVHGIMDGEFMKGRKDELKPVCII